MKTFTIGVVGNPNCGKTTLFNALTGARQRVGNWSGVTVDRKEGAYEYRGIGVRVVDMPGVYSFGVIEGMDSLDEKIARDYVLSGEPDLIVNIVDASNLERNIYLTAQLIEMRVPMIVAVNMIDVAEGLDIQIDVDVMSQKLGCPVVAMSASRGRGIADLKDTINRALESRPVPSAPITYPEVVEKGIEAILAETNDRFFEGGVNARWLAVKLLEEDDRARSLAGEAVLDVVAQLQPGIRASGEDADILIADGRYEFANAIARESVRRSGKMTRTATDAIDRIVVNRWLGVPIFLAVMYLMFTFTINVGGAFIDFFDIVAGAIFVEGVGALLQTVAAPEWVKVILADGIGSGIQVVATFIPIIGFLYLGLSVLEDSGYMARAAFVIDRFIRLIGLPGKAFVPLIVGFGCNVPSIMATRTLENQKDRIMTVAMSPFMSCGARLAVYALFAAAFFPVGGQNLVFALYLIGILIAVLTGFLLKKTLLRGETSAFVMELPSYHLPKLKGVMIHTWNRLKGFVFGAGQVIVIVVAVLSFLNSWGTDGTFGNEDSDKSVLSEIGRAIVPVFAPMGIKDDNWPAAVGIFTGVFAKEAVVGTLDSLYSTLGSDHADGGDVTTKDDAIDLIGSFKVAILSVGENLASIADSFGDPLGIGIVNSGSIESAAETQEVSVKTFGAMVERFDGQIGAFAYLLFILLYTPCIAAVGAIHREIGGRWALFIVTWTSVAAYAVSVGFYQVATLARHPLSSITWLGGISLSLVLVYAVLRRFGLNDRVNASPVSAIIE
ncbi:MAG: Fe(2+) transporter permease subunit FeoB [Rhodospirillales bacterium]|nr:Fe(2+) transporter permease subunit FeoB [Rhodospirillales bacterium]MCW8862004.1 Fe(2+) transporter permease subunit FeoB [Rhodospirillales bacterium]MCW8952980.1 Fe(2+) transporter permease subunit FeoB [Rhodospirillales bacterium]MCW8970634.1 Fe(2+) transporter permease subunit FeoB [Rhodospirillales bacterium]MCW9002334.1 Fe(2+) transporter permease subunit FeoB [Rhodospirillales bacterium]